jgi:hypothetical protein
MMKKGVPSWVQMLYLSTRDKVVVAALGVLMLLSGVILCDY